MYISITTSTKYYFVLLLLLLLPVVLIFIQPASFARFAVVRFVNFWNAFLDQVFQARYTS